MSVIFLMKGRQGLDQDMRVDGKKLEKVREGKTTRRLITLYGENSIFLRVLFII